MQEKHNNLLKNSCKAYDGMQTGQTRDQNQDLIPNVTVIHLRLRVYIRRWDVMMPVTKRKEEIQAK